MGNRIVEKELSYILTGLFFKIQKKFGRFCTEKQYCDAFEEELKLLGKPYLREKDIISINNEALKGNRLDFVVEGKIIIDFKAKAYITKDDYNQMQRYLKSANLELGLIVNMRNYNLRPKRVLNSSYQKVSDNSDSDSDH